MTLPVCHTHMTYIPLDPKLFFTSLNLYSKSLSLCTAFQLTVGHTHMMYITSRTHMAYHAIAGPSSNASIHCQVPCYCVLHFYLTHPIRTNMQGNVSNLICTSHFVYIVWCSLALTSIFEIHSNGC